MLRGMKNVAIQLTDKPSEDARAAVLDVLRQFTRESVPILDNQDFAALLTDADDRIVGGLVASSRWGGFHIDIMALPAALRGRGIGSKLLVMAEEEACRRACHHMLLDTQAFQARPFYERHGFEIFGQIDGPAPYYPRYFMHKVLI